MFPSSVDFRVLCETAAFCVSCVCQSSGIWMLPRVTSVVNCATLWSVLKMAKELSVLSWLMKRAPLHSIGINHKRSKDYWGSRSSRKAVLFVSRLLHDSWTVGHCFYVNSLPKRVYCERIRSWRFSGDIVWDICPVLESRFFLNFYIEFDPMILLVTMRKCVPTW